MHPTCCWSFLTTKCCAHLTTLFGIQVKIHGDRPNVYFRRQIDIFRSEHGFTDLPHTSPPQRAARGSLCVCVRKRPMLPREEGQYDVLTSCNQELLVVHEPKIAMDLSKTMKHHQFNFDRVFSEQVVVFSKQFWVCTVWCSVSVPIAFSCSSGVFIRRAAFCSVLLIWGVQASAQDVYNLAVAPALQTTLLSQAEGHRSDLTVFAYGQTGEECNYLHCCCCCCCVQWRANKYHCTVLLDYVLSYTGLF